MLASLNCDARYGAVLLGACALLLALGACGREVGLLLRHLLAAAAAIDAQL